LAWDTATQDGPWSAEITGEVAPESITQPVDITLA
jgi:hypothetical protein